MFDSRISIFVGHFGSGKTEVAVNYALKLVENNSKTAIVDFDIVNPFFRTVDARITLEGKNIWVVAPRYANTNIDVPALPAEINTLLENREYKVVFDVGGDDMGAKVLSRYNEDILKEDYEMFFVINTKRPMTDTERKIEEMIYEIESSSRLKISTLVNNTNLLKDTTAEDIIEGQRLIESVSKKLGIQVAFISGFGEPLREASSKTGVEAFYLEKLIELPFD